MFCFAKQRSYKRINSARFHLYTVLSKPDSKRTRWVPGSGGGGLLFGKMKPSDDGGVGRST